MHTWTYELWHWDIDRVLMTLNQSYLVWVVAERLSLYLQPIREENQGCIFLLQDKYTPLVKSYAIAHHHTTWCWLYWSTPTAVGIIIPCVSCSLLKPKKSENTRNLCNASGSLTEKCPPHLRNFIPETGFLIQRDQSGQMWPHCHRYEGTLGALQIFWREFSHDCSGWWTQPCGSNCIHGQIQRCLRLLQVYRSQYVTPFNRLRSGQCWNLVRSLRGF